MRKDSKVLSGLEEEKNENSVSRLLHPLLPESLSFLVLFS